MTPGVRLFAGVALIAALSGLAACDRSPQVSAGPKPPGVTVVAVGQRSVPVYGQYVGQTEAVKTVEVRARVEGFIERQVAPDGADVKVGDLLFVIDPRPFEAALRQAEANVARDTAQLRQAEAALTQREADVRQAQANIDRDLAQVENAVTQEERYRTLLQQGLIAREQYDQIRTNMTALEATVQADRAALENARAALAAARAAIENARASIRANEAAVDSARLQLGYTSVKSPLDGRMGRAEVRVGSLRRQGRGHAARHGVHDRSDVRQLQRERARGAVRVGAPPRGDAGAAGASGITMTLPDDSLYPQAGRLDFVDRAVDPRTGTLALRADLPESGAGAPARAVRARSGPARGAGRRARRAPGGRAREPGLGVRCSWSAPDQTVQARSVRMGPRVRAAVGRRGRTEARASRSWSRACSRSGPGMRVEPTIEATAARPGS